MACRYLFTNLRERQGKNYEDDIFKKSPMNVYTEDNFRKEFRMSKAEIIKICDKIVEDEIIYQRMPKNGSIKRGKILISIKTLASGSFQNCLKDFIKALQPTVNNISLAFTDCLSKKAKQFIYMPRNRAEEEIIKSEFYGIAGFAGVQGCINGTHIPIIAPSRYECAYINWKKILSIKVQSVCDPNVIFEDVVAKWPRPHHDSFILQLSTLYQNFENNSFSDAWLLRDSGYPLKKWLVTPLSNPVSSPEQKYKIAYQKKTLYN